MTFSVELMAHVLLAVEKVIAKPSAKIDISEPEPTEVWERRDAMRRMKFYVDNPGSHNLGLAIAQRESGSSLHDMPEQDRLRSMLAQAIFKSMNGEGLCADFPRFSVAWPDERTTTVTLGGDLPICSMLSGGHAGILAGAIANALNADRSHSIREVTSAVRVRLGLPNLSLF